MIEQHTTPLPEDNIAPDSSTIGKITNIVSTVLLVITLFVSGTVLALIIRWTKAERRKLRSKMLLGLFSSHFIVGITLFVLNLGALAGHHPRSNTPLCDATAILISIALWAEYLWTIALAIVTYCVLLHPVARITYSLKRRWAEMAMAIWVISIGLGGMQNLASGTIYVGGFCYTHSENVVYNELSVFGPRCLVFVVITFLYLRIHVFLRRTPATAAFSTITDESKLHQTPQGNIAAVPIANNSTPLSVPSTEPSKPRQSHWRTPTGGNTAFFNNKVDGESSSSARRRSGYASGTPPWEAIELPHCQLLNDPTQSPPQAVNTIPSIVAQDPRSTHFATWNIGDPTPTSQPVTRHGAIREDASPLSNRPSSNPILQDGASQGSTAASNGPASPPISAPDVPPAVQLTQDMPLVDSEGSSVAPSSKKPSVASTLVDPTSSLSSSGSPLRHQLSGAPPKPHASSSPPPPMESSATTLARKASILFLLFPLSYMVITAVGVVRLVSALVTLHPNSWLHAVSRWALFLQAPLDALTLYAASRYLGKRLRADGAVT